MLKRRKFGIDRRFVEDRRKLHNLDYFSKGGIERRKGILENDLDSTTEIRRPMLIDHVDGAAEPRRQLHRHALPPVRG